MDSLPRILSAREEQQLDRLVYNLDIADAVPGKKPYILSDDDIQIIRRLQEVFLCEELTYAIGSSTEVEFDNEELKNRVKELEHDIELLEGEANAASVLRTELYKLKESKQDMEDFYQDLLVDLNNQIVALKGTVIDAIKRSPTF